MKTITIIVIFVLVLFSMMHRKENDELVKAEMINPDKIEIKKKKKF